MMTVRGALADGLRHGPEHELLEQPLPGRPDDRQVVVGRPLDDGVDEPETTGPARSPSAETTT